MELDEFTEGFITCLFFTSSEEEFPEYCYGGEFNVGDSDIKRLTKDSLNRIVALCSKFQEGNKELLDQAGNPTQNGMDYCYTLGGHGVGFLDRAYDEGYSKEVAKALKEAAGYRPPCLIKQSKTNRSTKCKIEVWL